MNFLCLKCWILNHILIWSLAGFAENLIDETSLFEWDWAQTPHPAACLLTKIAFHLKHRKIHLFLVKSLRQLFLLQYISTSKILIFSWKIGKNKVCPLFICCSRQDFPLMLQCREGFKIKMCYFLVLKTPLSWEEWKFCAGDEWHGLGG